MKKLLFLFLLLTTSMCMHSFAQIPISLDSFYAPGSSWTDVVSTNTSPCSAGNDGNTEGIVYTVVRDSVGTGKVYHMLSMSSAGDYGYSVNCNAGGVTNYADGSSQQGPVFAMIRTDSGRVYFTLLASQTGGSNYDCDMPGTEYLFYDFNLGIGSSYPGTTLNSGISVGSIDTVSLSNGVKVPRYNGSLVYGIGSPEGFLSYWHLYVCGAGPGLYSTTQFLLCYNNPHFSYQFSYPAGTLPANLQYDCFDVNANMGYFDSLDAALNASSNPYSNTNSYSNTATGTYSIFPNPATDLLTVTNTVAISSISIVNTVGQLVYSIQYDPNYYIMQTEIDISAFPAGMYFIRVNGNNASKFVKQIPHHG